MLLATTGPHAVTWRCEPCEPPPANLPAPTSAAAATALAARVATVAAVAAASAAAGALAAARWARCRAACSSYSYMRSSCFSRRTPLPPPWSSRSGRCSSHLRGEPRVKQRCQRPLVTRNEDGRGVGSGCTARIMRHESGMLSQRARASGAGACHPRQRTRARAGLRTQCAIARSRTPIMRVAPAATRKRFRLHWTRSLKSAHLSPRSNGGKF